MQKITYETSNSKQTQKLGEILAKEILAIQKLNFSRPKRSKEVELQKAFIICLSGELGSGKTTFTQGLLKGLKVKGPHTSPTFLVIKNYKKEIQNPKSKIQNKSKNSKFKIQNVYHIDTYRIGPNDILNLGWEEIIANPKNIVIIEWADRIKKIIPKSSLWVKFEWIDENRRKIEISSKLRIKN